MSTVTWTPPTTTLANMCGWVCAGFIPFGGYYYVDEGDSTDWHGVAVRLTGTAVSGTITSAILTIPRGADNNGGNGTLRIRCEASAAPATYASGSPPAQPNDRTYRTAAVDFDFPASSTTNTIDVTSLLTDLIGAYTTISAISIVIGGASLGTGWGSAGTVSWRQLWPTNSPPSLAITYSTSQPGDITAGSVAASTMSISAIGAGSVVVADGTSAFAAGTVRGSAAALAALAGSTVTTAAATGSGSVTAAVTSSASESAVVAGSGSVAAAAATFSACSPMLVGTATAGCSLGAATISSATVSGVGSVATTALSSATCAGAFTLSSAIVSPCVSTSTTAVVSRGTGVVACVHQATVTAPAAMNGALPAVTSITTHVAHTATSAGAAQVIAPSTTNVASTAVVGGMAAATSAQGSFIGVAATIQGIGENAISAGLVSHGIGSAALVATGSANVAAGAGSSSTAIAAGTAAATASQAASSAVSGIVSRIIALSASANASVQHTATPKATAAATVQAYAASFVSGQIDEIPTITAHLVAVSDGTGRVVGIAQISADFAAMMAARATIGNQLVPLGSLRVRASTDLMYRTFTDTHLLYRATTEVT